MGKWQMATPSAMFGALLLLISAWLAWCVIQVNIDFDDGYATLANSSYWLGQQSDVYFANRGPLLVLVLMPAQLIKTALGLHPMDVRVAHAQLAILHLAYLIGTWNLLHRAYGRDVCTLLAYTAALATPVFFSYAPFLNQDIFPGALALWMVYLADQQLRSPSRSRWLALVVLGASLAMLKQSFTLVWLCLVAAVPLLLLAQRGDRHQWRAARGLLLAAALSGALTWIAYGIVLQAAFPAEAWWLRPWLQITQITSNYASEGGAWDAFFQWIYLQNLWAFGILAMMLVLPGLALALQRGNSFERLAALVWLFLVITLHLTPYKEVRYLALLAPFNAVLLVPVLRLIWKGRAIYRGVVLIVFGLGLALSVAEAARVRDPYYSDTLLHFLEPLANRDTFKGRLIMGTPLSFVSPEDQAFFGDRYHRITHLSLPPIISSYSYQSHQYLQVNDAKDVTAQLIRAGDIWLLSSGALGRAKPFVRGNRQGLAKSFVQTLSVAETITLTKQAGGYRISGPNAWAPYHFVSVTPKDAPAIVVGQLSDALAVALFAWEEMPESAEIVAFRVLRYCTLLGCTAVGQHEAAALAASLAKPATK